MMQTRSAGPGTTPVLQLAAVVKLPPAGLVQSVLHGELKRAQPCRALVSPSATMHVIAPAPVGSGTPNDPVIDPPPSATADVSSVPVTEFACSSTVSPAM